jgi:hypothetical protein
MASPPLMQQMCAYYRPEINTSVDATNYLLSNPSINGIIYNSLMGNIGYAYRVINTPDIKTGLIDLIDSTSAMPLSMLLRDYLTSSAVNEDPSPPTTMTTRRGGSRRTRRRRTTRKHRSKRF